MDNIQSLDPETEFLASKRQTGNEWELFKENVRPLKRGRNVNLLNNALKSQTDHHLKNSLLDNRRRLIAAIDEYKGDDPLQPWLECIKWVQESFPPGGDCSGLIVIYEQCVRTFWHSECYKDDLRYLKVWLEYVGFFCTSHAENCVDAEVIYNFLDANDIGKTHSVYYISYALYMESKNKVKATNEIFNLGISKNAQPVEKLKDAYRKFLARSMSRPKPVHEDSMENCAPVRSFGTVLAKANNGRQSATSSDTSKKQPKPNRSTAVPLTIFKDKNADITSGHQLDMSNTSSWHTIGARAERNKENTAIATKWTTYKVPQKPGRVNTGASIEVFVDEDCLETDKEDCKDGKTAGLKLRQGDGKDLNKETELLKENPLRNFPPNSLPR